MSIAAFIHILLAPLITYITCKYRIDRRLLLLLAVILSIIGSLLTGPSSILSLPEDSTGLTLTGFIIISLSFTMCLVISHPDIMRAVHLKTGYNILDPNLSLVASLYISVSVLLGMIFGPLFSGFLG